MHFPIKILSLFLFLFNFHPLFSQTESKDYDITSHSADNNSLPQNSVKSIIKDKNGFIWMTTENGLVRYDGNKFDVFNIENIKGINSNRMRPFRGSITKDSLYLQNDFLEYILINNNKVSFLKSKKVPANFVINSKAFSDKRLYVNKIHKKDNSYYSLENDAVSYYLSNNKLQWKTGFVYDYLTKFFLFENELYVIRDKEVLKFTKNKIISAGKNKIYDNLSTILINNVSQQTIVIKGLDVSIVARSKNEFYLKAVVNNYDLSKNNIVSAFYDTQNELLFLGSATLGLTIIKKKIFNSVSGNIIDRVYYAQVPYGTSKFLASSGEVFSTTLPSSNPIVKLYDEKYSDKYNLVVDKNDDIWTKTDNNVYKFHKKTNFKTFTKWIFKDRISIIYKLKNEQIIIGTGADNQINGKLYLSNFSPNNNAFVTLINLNFIPTCLLETEKNNLWTGSNVGFHKINIQTKKFTKNKKLSKSIVRNLYATKPNEIWITTYNKGFFLYNATTKVTTKFPLDKNKYLLSSHCIVEDAKGFFWIPTNKGLFQVSKQNLLQYAKKKTTSVYYHYYDQSDGFNTNEFNGGCQPCGLLLKNNFITFPSMNGNVLFNSLNVVPKLPTNTVFFEQAKVDDKVIAIVGNNVTVNQGFERLGIYIHSPYYGNANNLNIEVKFDGPITQKWRNLKDNYISFTTLPPGTYTLTARKLSGFNSQYKYQKLKITIPKLFYQTNFFYFLLLILFIVILLHAIKIRTQYIKRNNVLLQNKIAEQTFQLKFTVTTLKKTTETLQSEIANHKKLIGAITHDIKSPLRFLAITGKHLYKNRNDVEAIKDDIENVYSSSNQLYNFVDNLLEYTKVADHENHSEPYKLFDLIEEKKEIFLNIALSKKTSILNLVDENEIFTINRQLLSIIIHNLLDNAVKNTFSGKIKFSLMKNSDEMIIIIEDTGIGISDDLVKFYNNREFLKIKNQKSIGMGIQMVSELLDIIKGEMKIESSVNLGTKIILLFKI